MVASENAARRRNGVRIVLAVLAAAAVMAAFYVMNYYTFLCYDDYYFSFSRATGERLTSLSQILPSMIAGSQTDIVKVTIGLIGGVFLGLGVGERFQKFPFDTLICVILRLPNTHRCVIR